ncbi:unnamed protein product [Rotaria sp. Silwood1]|nr:unnamed protein product [Rotaria sp. Silwood1]
MSRSRSPKYRQSRREHSPDDMIDQLNIRSRTCYSFAPSQRKDNGHEDNCECRRPQDEHSDKNQIGNSRWTMELNTREEINAEHGQLPNGAQFVRLALDTPKEKAEKILLHAWKLPEPSFIVSVVGGAKHFKMTDQLETNFINGLIDLVNKSDAWLVTNGYATGIVRLVGEAIHQFELSRFNENPITAIGICKWGCIMDVDKITLPMDEETQQITTHTLDVTPNNRLKQRRSGEWDLEMHHSHYLMLDDGTTRNYDTQNYRTHLVTHMAKINNEHDFFVPVVTIMVEGGLDSIENIYYDLRSNIPVIIIDGSGRAADFFTRWLLWTKDLDNDVENQDIVCQIEELDDEDDIKQFTKVMYCLQPAVRFHLTVFNLNSDTDLSETIFRSICRSRQRFIKMKEQKTNEQLETRRRRLAKLNSGKQKTDDLADRSKIMKKDQVAEQTRLLDLAMKWDCITVAREFIFQNSLDNILGKDKYFIKALKENLPNFVYEFLKLGIDPANVFFSKKRHSETKSRYARFIKELYDNKLMDIGKTHLKKFIQISKHDTSRIINDVESLNLLLKHLIGAYMYELYFDTLEDEHNYQKKWGLIEDSGTLKQDENENTINEKDLLLKPEEKKDYKYIMRDLFLWAVLMNRIEMAKVFLSFMKNRICPALIATKILKQYHSVATYGDLKKAYIKDATYFEKYAITCLDKCDDHDVHKSCEIILRQNELYGYVTCLQVASDAQDKLFIAEPASIEAMNNIWYDKLHPEQASYRHRLALFFGIVSLGLLAPVFVKYRESKEARKRKEAVSEKFRDNGINYGDPKLLEYPLILRSQTDSAPILYLRKLAKFHRSLPMKFCYHVITYIFFLLLFSYFLLFNFSPPKSQSPSIHWTEILTIILVSCILIEEIHYFFTQDSLTFEGKLESYRRDYFKPMTILAIILFYIGLILRFANAGSEDKFMAARIVMAIDLEIWWLRCLSFIIVIPYLGPHLVAIWKMIQDLLFFMVIIAVVMIGYGVASRSMVYYPRANNFTMETGGSINNSFDGRTVFRHIIYPVYYFLYGDFGDELTNLDSNPEAGWSIADHVLLAIHMIFVNILLTNLLIAMFTKRFDKVYEDTRNIWHSQQYLFTREYFSRSPFLPPISLLYDIYYLARMFFFYIRRKHFQKSADRDSRVFKIISKKKHTIKEWNDFEDAFTSEYAHDEVKALNNASIKSKSGSDSDNKENKDDMMKDHSGLTDANNNLKQVQNDLNKLKVLVEGLNKELNDEIEKKISQNGDPTNP